MNIRCWYVFEECAEGWRKIAGGYTFHEALAICYRVQMMDPETNYTINGE